MPLFAIFCYQTVTEPTSGTALRIGIDADCQTCKRYRHHSRIMTH